MFKPISIEEKNISNNFDLKLLGKSKLKKGKPIDI